MPSNSAQADLQAALDWYNIEGVRRALAAGADPNVLDNSGRPPLAQLVTKKWSKAIQRHIDDQASLDLIPDALRVQWKLAQVLIEAGALTSATWQKHAEPGQPSVSHSIAAAFFWNEVNLFFGVARTTPTASINRLMPWITGGGVWHGPEFAVEEGDEKCSVLDDLDFQIYLISNDPKTLDFSPEFDIFIHDFIVQVSAHDTTQANLWASRALEMYDGNYRLNILFESPTILLDAIEQGIAQRRAQHRESHLNSVSPRPTTSRRPRA